MKSDYTTNSRYITHTIAFWKVGRIHFLSSGVKGLKTEGTRFFFLFSIKFEPFSSPGIKIEEFHESWITVGSVAAALSGPASVPLGKEGRLNFSSQRLETEPRITTISGFEEPGRGQNHATSHLLPLNAVSELRFCKFNSPRRPFLWQEHYSAGATLRLLWRSSTPWTSGRTQASRSTSGRGSMGRCSVARRSNGEARNCMGS